MSAAELTHLKPTAKNTLLQSFHHEVGQSPLGRWGLALETGCGSLVFAVKMGRARVPTRAIKIPKADWALALRLGNCFRCTTLLPQLTQEFFLAQILMVVQKLEQGIVKFV